MDLIPLPTRPLSVQTSITNLSTELIFYILEFVDPESHLDFACTCKWLAACSSDVLRRHQDAFSKYRAASDLSPDTVPTLLRSAYGQGDPLLAWHVRSFEIWCNRDSWEDWKTFKFDGPPQSNVENLPVKWKFLDGEISGYLEFMEGQLGDEATEAARAEIENGKDGALKMLLLANFPRLRSLKFITRSHGVGTCLRWTKTAIEGSTQCCYWPPGFTNLRDVAVGVPSETWMDDDDPNPSTLVLCALLRLPHLETIYYNDLRRIDWDDPTDYDLFLPAHSSNVKHIFLDNCDDLSYEFRNALCEAPQNLLTLAFRAGDAPNRLDDADQLVSGMVKSQTSLQTMMFYGYSNRTIHGYRCSAYRPEEIQDSDSLKTFAINVKDIELDAYYQKEDAVKGRNTVTDRQHFIDFFQRAFPHSLEVLVLWSQVTGGVFLKCDEGDDQLDWLEEALIVAIEAKQRAGSEDNCEDECEDKEECKDKNECEEDECKEDECKEDDGCEEDECEDEAMGSVTDSQDNESEGEGNSKDLSEHGSDDSHDTRFDKVIYRNLRAVYFEETERNYDSHHTKKLYFQKLIALGKEAGVDVHVLTNRNKMQHSIEFPQAPDRYDLQTGPWWERRREVADWEFDIYKGKRVPPGCGKCGTCEVCLSMYSKELWASIAEV